MRASGLFLAPEDAKSTGEQSELVNEDLQTDGEGEDVEREREKVLWEDARAQMKEDEENEKANEVRPE